MDHDTYCYNIMSVYRRATADEITHGMSWYDGAHALALELSPDDVWRAAGVIAAFSPLTPWERNVELAITSLVWGGARTETLGNSVSAAQRIIMGEHPFDVLRGDKTRAFCAAIADPFGSTIATIDRHAHDVAMGRVHIDSERKIGKRVFREMSAAYVECAEYLGVSVAQVQAITWVVWRREKGLK